LEIGSCFWPRQPSSYFMFHVFHHHWDDSLVPASPDFFSIEMGSHRLLSGLVWNLDPPDLSLPRSLGWLGHITAPSYWLRWGSQELFSLSLSWTLILQISASQVARITSMGPPVRWLRLFLTSWQNLSKCFIFHFQISFLKENKILLKRWLKKVKIIFQVIFMYTIQSKQLILYSPKCG
jgi:hypothetical protein